MFNGCCGVYIWAICINGKVGGKMTTGFEEEAEAKGSDGLVMVKMSGMGLWRTLVNRLIVDQESISGMTLSFPLKCLISNVYCENHAASLNN